MHKLMTLMSIMVIKKITALKKKSLGKIVMKLFKQKSHEIFIYTSNLSIA